MSVDADYDVIVMGGSIAGLLAAREVAATGLSVTVFEEHNEIGLPEKCDGLVSTKGITSLGIVPKQRAVQNYINGALLYSPNGTKIEIDARKQKIVVLDRAEFDRGAASTARSYGSDIKISKAVTGVKQNELVEVETNEGIATCKIAIDAMGCSSLIKKRRNGVIQAAKYEVHGTWFDTHKVELYLDQRVSPGFFSWVIPIDETTAKVGVAGDGINPFRALDEFVKRKKATVVKKIAAPIVVGGPLASFVDGHVVSAGDSAGQTKPTTAGGIYSGGVGGILAGQASARAIMLTDDRYLQEYQKKWDSMFGRDFSVTLQVRRIFEKLENKHIDEIFASMASSGEVLESLSLEGDFDFHSFALMKALGLKSVLKILKVITTNELKRFLPLVQGK
ncbi:MAG: geranylgeranyl reductase family protein [Thaumarchaeota archaeon]|nr:geranylgeranyl reductase family protein [Nitrososphaerota archaeon]